MFHAVVLALVAPLCPIESSSFLQEPAGPPSPTWADVQPIFKDNCVVCHGGADATWELDLETRSGVLKGSRGGPVVVSDKPEESELVKRLLGTTKPQMPLGGPPFLGDDEIDLVAR